MEFGDKYRFAITLDLNENYGGAWLFGRICYWIQGSMVGHYNEGTSLRDVLFQMTYIVGDSGRRFCPELINLKKEKIFTLIDAVLDDRGDEIYQYIPPDFLPARFDIRIPVDVFDSWKIFLIEGEGKARLLCCKAESVDIEETVLKAGEFEKIFKEAHHYLDCLYDAEVARENEFRS